MEFIKKIRPYVISVAISLGVGLLSALITKDSMSIYSEINTPPLAPPPAVFPIAWSILYILMGISAARIYIKRKESPKEARDALAVYAMSLIVNFTWSIIFFSLGSFLVAFVWLLLLLALVLATMVRYHALDKLAAYLQIPYVLWLIFAGYLNLAIFILNP